MSMTARHFANFAPSSRYSTSRWRSPSSPSVTSSPGAIASGAAALVDLDAGDDPLLLEDLDERPSVGGVLPDRLVEEDHAADVLGGTVGGEQHLAVRAPPILGRLGVDRVEPLLDRPAALVGGEDPLARRDDRARHSRSARRDSYVHSHSIVPGGFDVMSYATRFTPGTSLMTRLEMRSSTSYGQAGPVGGHRVVGRHRAQDRSGTRTCGRRP